MEKLVLNEFNDETINDIKKTINELIEEINLLKQPEVIE